MIEIQSLFKGVNQNYYHNYSLNFGLRSVAGLVIQATGRMEFEDGLKPGSPGGVLSDNPGVRTSSLVTAKASAVTAVTWHRGLT